MCIRKAQISDLSRIAEIYVFNERINYLPIFNDYDYCFNNLQVTSIIDNFFGQEKTMNQMYVYDDGLIKGFMIIEEKELKLLYIDPFFQSQGIGSKMVTYAIEKFHISHLWAIQKNVRAVSFYEKNGFHLTEEKKCVPGTSVYEILLKR